MRKYSSKRKYRTPYSMHPLPNKHKTQKNKNVFFQKNILKPIKTFLNKLLNK